MVPDELKHSLRETEVLLVMLGLIYVHLGLSDERLVRAIQEYVKQRAEGEE